MTLRRRLARHRSDVGVVYVAAFAIHIRIWLRRDGTCTRPDPTNTYIAWQWISRNGVCWIAAGPSVSLTTPRHWRRARRHCSCFLGTCAGASKFGPPASPRFPREICDRLPMNPRSGSTLTPSIVINVRSKRLSETVVVHWSLVFTTSHWHKNGLSGSEYRVLFPRSTKTRHLPTKNRWTKMYKIRYSAKCARPLSKNESVNIAIH